MFILIFESYNRTSSLQGNFDIFVSITRSQRNARSDVLLYNPALSVDPLDKIRAEDRVDLSL